MSHVWNYCAPFSDSESWALIHRRTTPSRWNSRGITCAKQDSFFRN